MNKCKSDGSKLVLKKAHITSDKLRKQYYYTHYYLCPTCNKIYFNDEYRVVNSSTSNLFETEIVDDSNYDVHIWTDGASSNNGKPNARAAWAFHSPNHEESGLVEGRQTNNVAEATAILKALEWASGENFKKIKIHTDSQISLFNLSKSHKKVKVNAEIFAKIAEVIDNHKLEVEYKKVLGHSGDKNNDRADFLATSLLQ